MGGCRGPHPRTSLALALLLPLAGLLPSGAGCLRPAPIRLDPLPGSGNAPPDYEEVLARSTREVQVYRDFEAKVFVTATYLSPEWRHAYIARRTAIHSLPRNERAALEQEQEQAARRYHEFFLAVYTGDRRWNDLDSRGSMWRLALVNDRGEEVQPVEVVRVDARYSDVTSFYPYLDVFKTGYLVRFPKIVLETNTPILDSTCSSFRIRLSSAIGMAEVEWEVARNQSQGQSQSVGEREP